MNIYEQISDAESKLEYLPMIIGTFVNLECVSEENFDILVSNAVGFCTKILKKNEQCTTLMQASHLFHNAAKVDR